MSVGAALFALALALGTDSGDGFVFAIGVTVALVPEGLLPTVTLSLAVGAQRMARRQGLVRRLESVETLGSTTFVCTDRTGTLTQNEMAVVEVWTPGGTARVSGRGCEARCVMVLADSAADTVVRSGESVALPAMSDTDREIVREHLRWRTNLVARSEGEGPERHVVVIPI